MLLAFTKSKHKSQIRNNSINTVQSCYTPDAIYDGNLLVGKSCGGVSGETLRERKSEKLLVTLLDNGNKSHNCEAGKDISRPVRLKLTSHGVTMRRMFDCGFVRRPAQLRLLTHVRVMSVCRFKGMIQEVSFHLQAIYFSKIQD